MFYQESTLCGERFMHTATRGRKGPSLSVRFNEFFGDPRNLPLAFILFVLGFVWVMRKADQQMAQEGVAQHSAAAVSAPAVHAR